MEERWDWGRLQTWVWIGLYRFCDRGAESRASRWGGEVVLRPQFHDVRETRPIPNNMEIASSLVRLLPASKLHSRRSTITGTYGGCGNTGGMGNRRKK